MRAVPAVVVALCAAGCDHVFGLDRVDAMPDTPAEVDAAVPDALDAPPLDIDRDGVDDLVDPCLAAMVDDTGNFDGDSKLNVDDTCPFNGSEGNDPDMDGIGSSCDPHGNLTDRSLCVMDFNDPSLNVALWAERAPEEPWGTALGSLTVDASDIATAIATQSLEGVNSISYHGVFRIDAGGGDGSLTMWIRADPAAASPDDIGCRYTKIGGTGRVGIVRGSTVTGEMSAGVLTTGVNDFRLRATAVTVGANVSVECASVLSGSNPVFASATVPLPQVGRFGVSADRFAVTLLALHIMDTP